MGELTSALSKKAAMKSIRLGKAQLQESLQGYRLPPGGIDLLIIARDCADGEPPWLLMKVGKPSLAGVELEIFELLDNDLPATKLLRQRSSGS